MEPNPISTLRHAARGSFNAIKLCTSALTLPCTRQEQVEFLDDVLQTCDMLCGELDDLSAAFERGAAGQTG